jgi:hypothetical protein
MLMHGRYGVSFSCIAPDQSYKDKTIKPYLPDFIKPRPERHITFIGFEGPLDKALTSMELNQPKHIDYVVEMTERKKQGISERILNNKHRLKFKEDMEDEVHRQIALGLGNNYIKLVTGVQKERINQMRGV